MFSGSVPDKRQATGISGSLRGANPSTARLIAAICCGAVPQQPPTILRKPASAHSRICFAIVGVEIVFTKGVGQPGVRVGGDVAFRNTRQFLYVLAQFVWPQRTVQAKGQRFGVAQEL